MLNTFTYKRVSMGKSSNVYSFLLFSEVYRFYRYVITKSTVCNANAIMKDLYNY